MASRREIGFFVIVKALPMVHLQLKKLATVIQLTMLGGGPGCVPRVLAGLPADLAHPLRHGPLPRPPRLRAGVRHPAHRRVQLPQVGNDR